MTIHTSPVTTCAAWARDVTASDEIRTAAIAALVECADTNPAAADALASITDPTGIRLRTEARNAIWADDASDLTPFGRDLRRQMQANAAPIRPDMAQTTGQISDLWLPANTPRRGVIARIGRAIMAALLGVAAVQIAVMMWGLPDMMADIAAQAVARGL